MWFGDVLEDLDLEELRAVYDELEVDHTGDGAAKLREWLVGEVRPHGGVEAHGAGDDDELWEHDEDDLDDEWDADDAADKYAESPEAIREKVLTKASGHGFYNTSKLSFAKLLDDPTHIAQTWSGSSTGSR